MGAQSVNLFLLQSHPWDSLNCLKLKEVHSVPYWHFAVKVNILFVIINDMSLGQSLTPMLYLQRMGHVTPEILV